MNDSKPADNHGTLTAPLGLLVNSASSQPAQKTEETPDTTAPDETQEKKYDNSMEVDEIMQIMTMDEAFFYTVDVGINKGRTIGDIAESKPDSLKWYFTSYTGPDNCLRAAAKIVADYAEKIKAKAA